MAHRDLHVVEAGSLQSGLNIAHGRSAGHTTTEIRGSVHTTVATPGDLLFHIRSERTDMCFELENLILEALGSAVTVVDEVQGFRYFDARDLFGFVDGTENPTGDALALSSLIQPSDDPDFAGGSYVVVQKYLQKQSSAGIAAHSR